MISLMSYFCENSLNAKSVCLLSEWTVLNHLSLTIVIHVCWHVTKVYDGKVVEAHDTLHFWSAKHISNSWCLVWQTWLASLLNGLLFFKMFKLYSASEKPLCSPFVLYHLTVKRKQRSIQQRLPVFLILRKPDSAYTYTYNLYFCSQWFN